MPQSPLNLVAQLPSLALSLLRLDKSGNLKTIINNGYRTAAASGTRTLGTGAIGDVLTSVTIIPATVDAGAVQIKDGANAAITIFTGGTASLADLKPVTVPLNAVSTAGGWSLVMGAAVSAVASGQFTA